ncbi:MAG: membrane protein insertion efficiency factor YidD [Deltaproteobacteria bacterium]|nr:membrane protein insertion efficiency factor YidD [Deltaproteobacteria bacterium]
MKKSFIAAITLYQRTLSLFLPRSCRFVPSCSHYCKEALEKRGLLGGLFLTLKRLLRCHPLSEGGWDPVL